MAPKFSSLWRDASPAEKAPSEDSGRKFHLYQFRVTCESEGSYILFIHY